MRTKNKIIISILAVVVFCAAVFIPTFIISCMNDDKVTAEDMERVVSTNTTEYLKSFINSGAVESIVSSDLNKDLSDDQLQKIMDALSNASGRMIREEIDKLKEETLTEEQYESLKNAILRDFQNADASRILSSEESEYIIERVINELREYINSGYMTSSDIQQYIENYFNSHQQSGGDSNAYKGDFNNLKSELRNLSNELRDNKNAVENAKDQSKSDDKKISGDVDSLRNEFQTQNDNKGDEIAKLKNKDTALSGRIDNLDTWVDSYKAPTAVIDGFDITSNTHVVENEKLKDATSVTVNYANPRYEIEPSYALDSDDGKLRISGAKYTHVENIIVYY